jgi:hypothetical protein
VRKIKDIDAENHAIIKFLVELGDGAFYEILLMALYSNVLKTLRMKTSPLNKRSGFLMMPLDIKVHSESPTRTGEDLSINDPVTLASHDLKHDLLGCPGWKKA